MARGSKRKTQKELIEEAAELAADETLENIDPNETLFEDDNVEVTFEPSEVSVDVFEEGFRKAVALKDAPRYYIKKNSQFLTVKDYPYSWEQLQKEYGPGWYQVQCKARSNGRILKGQTEMVGDPNEGKQESTTTNDVHHQEESDKNLALLGWLQQNQERAEQRAREQAKSSESGLATVMQAVMTSQQESNKTMMQMMMESSKQTQALLLTLMQSQNQPKGADPMMTLLTTMITQQNKNDGFTAAGVMKMVQDAEIRAEQRAVKNFELIEKKSNELAEIKAEALVGQDEAEESLSKSLLKGFVPVLSQMIAQQNTGGGTAQISAPTPTLAQAQEYMTQQSLRPNVRGTQTNQAQTVQTQAVKKPVPRERPVAGQTETVIRPVLTAEQKEAIFNFVGGDIGQALVSGTQATVCANDVLLKLEKQNVPRQTIARGFTVEDFYGFADRYIPAESLSAAKAWLKEFFDAIQRLAVSPNATANAKAATSDGTVTEQTVSKKRSATATSGAGTQPSSNP